LVLALFLAADGPFLVATIDLIWARGPIYLGAILVNLITVTLYLIFRHREKSVSHQSSAQKTYAISFPSNASILAIGTALPPNEISMEVVASAFEDHIAGEMNISPEVSTWVKRRIEGSGIEKRWTVCPSLHDQFAGKAPGLYGDAPNRNPSAGARNAVWIEEATKLAIQSATVAMKNFKGSKADITHVLFHSCTGFKAPGIELDIIEALGLPNVRRKFGVNFMGCFGGFTILQTAKYICDAEPGSHVLCVCAELCTLHQDAEDHRSAQMGIVLFGDASAAVVVGPGGIGDWSLTQGKSVVLPKESKGSMTWQATDHAYRMWLDKTIAASLGKALYRGWKSWFQHAMGISDPTLAEWAVHPGGIAILDAVLDKRIGITGPSGGLDKDHLKHSYSVLKDVGNVSSCSIFFVLERMLLETKRDLVFMLGFGPGLTVEYTGLRKL